MSPCIDSNPDIAGIGVRVSIYTQAFLSLVPAALFMASGHITSYEENALNRIYANLLITACALLVSAFIQAAKFGLNAYHALIVLNLSWINNAGAIVWSFNYFASRHTGDGLCDFLRMHLFAPFFKRSSMLASMHLCAMAGLGIWVWARLEVFGANPECTPDILTSVFGRSVPLSNKPLRAVSLAFYSVAAIPVINLLFFLLIFLVWAPVVIALGLCLEPYIPWFRQADRSVYVFGVMSGALLDILFLVDTQLLVTRNEGRVKEGEGEWSFGQTLAVLMVVVPAIEVWKEVEIWRKGRDLNSSHPIIAKGSFIRLDNRHTRVYYQGVDNYIYESRSRGGNDIEIIHRRVSSEAPHPNTGIVSIAWSDGLDHVSNSRFPGRSEWPISSSKYQIRVYYIDQHDNIREIACEIPNDDEEGFVVNPEPLAKTARNGGLLHAIPTHKALGRIRVGFISASNPEFITEVVVESERRASDQPNAGIIANGFAIQLSNGDSRIYYQGDDGHIYERRGSSSRCDIDISSTEVFRNTRVVAVTWGDNFRHIRVYYLDQGRNIREIYSDYGAKFVHRPDPVARAALDSGLLYATTNAETYGRVTVVFHSMSHPASINEVSFRSVTSTSRWRGVLSRVLGNWSPYG